MLTRIMKELKKSGGTSLSELCNRFKVEPSALDGMLETLVRQGKIKEVYAEVPACSNCCNSSGCPYAGTNAGLGKGKLYIIN